jgi:hypothetical protein
MREIGLASEFLRSMAPAQSHDGRREFFKAAELLDGVRLRGMEDMVLVSIPVYRGDERLGDVQVTIQTGLTKDEIVSDAVFVVFPPRDEGEQIGRSAGR